MLERRDARIRTRTQRRNCNALFSRSSVYVYPTFRIKRATANAGKLVARSSASKARHSSILSLSLSTVDDSSCCFSVSLLSQHQQQAEDEWRVFLSNFKLTTTVKSLVARRFVCSSPELLLWIIYPQCICPWRDTTINDNQMYPKTN